jgi:hypothetical protein
MHFLQGQGWFSFFWIRSVSLPRISGPKKSSYLAFVFVVVVHCSLIIAAFNQRLMRHEEFLVETQVTLVLLQQEESQSVQSENSLSHISKHSIALPEISFPDVQIENVELNIPYLNEAYELPNKKSERYKNVFDPKLRKKLQELPPVVKAKPKIQYLGVGITLEDIGNGKCIYGDAFHKAGSIVKCGPNEGERMMQNVERALEDPLGLK